MNKKYGSKAMMLLMVVALLPVGDLAGLGQAIVGGNVTPTTLKKTLSTQSVSAQDSSTETAGNALVPSASTPSSDNMKQPTRPELPIKEVASAKSGFGYQSSITGLDNVTNGKIAVIKAGKTVQSFTSVSDANVRAALYYMYANPDPFSDWALFIGGNVTLDPATTSKSLNGSASESNMNFASLTDKVKSLTLISTPKDNLANGNTSSASEAQTISLPSNNYFSADTVFRNINVNGSSYNLYAQGNALAVLGGAWFSGSPTIYGGTDNGALSRDTNLYFVATGSGNFSIYGGNATGGAINGTTHVTIAGTSNQGSIAVLSAGNAAGGVISGNTNLSVTSASVAIKQINGAGVGTASAPVLVNGSVINSINSSSNAVKYGNIWGGVQYGNITGSVYNTVSGQGGWTNAGNGGFSNFSGGSFRGNIGSKGVKNVISNKLDSSSLTALNGQVLFNGGNSGISQTYQKGTPSSTPAMSSGIIYADITNYIRGASGIAGAIYGVVGGNGHDASPLSPADLGLSSNTNTDYNPNADTAKAWSANDPKVIDSNAQKNTASAIFGNIYTWEQGGMMSTAGSGANDWDGFSYGGSIYGYVNGQTVLELGSPNADSSVGGAGMVYAGPTSGLSSDGSGGANGNWAYSKENARANSSGWDAVGGGGPVWTYQSSYLQTGDSYLIHQNDVARWTYGGNFGSFHYGNSYNILNAGIVDTLEGGGYTATINWGDTNSKVVNGQVNWFLSGGSWGDLYTTGNAQLNVYNGVINGIAGGNYGQAKTETIAGNSTVNVFGGDFSGNPRTGDKQLSGGSFFGGSVLGNTTLNLDLTGPTGPSFKFPNGTYLSGGGGYNNNDVYTGNGKDKSITLNVATSPANGMGSVLNGAILYGDGTNGARTNIGSINMNINADGSSVGSIYGTNYTQNLKYNTNINISDGVNITGTVTSGGPADDYTNAIVSGNPNKSTIRLGNNTSNHPITISGKLSNFTHAEISPKTTVNVAGSFLNGGGANAGNHASAYSQFGQLTLGAGATLGFANSSSILSIGKMVVGKDSRISTPYLQSAGVLNLSDLDMSNGNLQWIPTGNPPTSIPNTYAGAYWGSQKGFPVLTFNGGDPSKSSGAGAITPDKFSGIDSKNNYAFLGDYTISQQTSPSTPTWIGYVVPGQIRVFNTTNLNGAVGNWQHSLSGISTGTPKVGDAMTAWASVTKDTDTAELKIMYTMGYRTDNKQPYSFKATAPGYIKSRTASRYDGNILNSYSKINPNFDVTVPNSGASRSFTSSDYFTGDTLDGTQTNQTYGSYIINNVVTDNVTSLSVQDWIIHNDKDDGSTTPDGSAISASNLTQDQLYKLAHVKGVGVMSDLALTSSNPIASDSNSLMDLIHQGIGSADYKDFKLHWSLGNDTSANSNLVIVPDATQISGGDNKGQYALNVFDGSMSSSEAKSIKNQGFYESRDSTSIDNYTHALCIKANGAVEAPVLNDSATAVETFNNITSSSSVPLTYNYKGLTKKVLVQVSVGALAFTSAPDALDFGAQSIVPNTLISFPQFIGNKLVVTDTRTGSSVTPWSLYVTQTSPLVQVDGSGKTIVGGNSLDGLMFLSTDAKTQTQLSNQQVLVHRENSTTGNNVWTLNDDWNKTTGKGISVQIPAERQATGAYLGSLTWTLQDTPSN